MNVVENGLGWDDELIIPSLGGSAPTDETTARTDHPYFRPLVGWSYRFDYWMWGERPAGFHLSVLAAHGINTGLVFHFVRLLIGSAPPPMTFLPFLTSSLFAVHPAHAEAVAWIAGRNDVFCATFLLIAFNLYLAFRRGGRPILFAGSMLSLALALMTKELAVGLVFLFPLYEILRRSSRDNRSGPPEGPTHESGRWPLIFSSVPLLWLGIYLGARAMILVKPLGGIVSGDQASAGEILSKAVISIGLYLKMMALPIPHEPFISVLPDSIPALVLSTAGVIGFSSVFLRAVLTRNLPLSVGAAWTGLLIAPAVPIALYGIASTPAAERYTYAPSVGFLMTAGWMILTGLDRAARAYPAWSSRTWKGMAVVAALVVLASAYESRRRNTVWKNPVTFWEAAVAVPPDDAKPKSIAHLKLGLAYRQENRLREAIAQYHRALDIRPDYVTAHNNLGNAYQQQRDFESAVRHFRMAIDLEPEGFMPYFNMGHALGLQDRHEEAVQAYRDAIERNPKFERAYNNLGNELGELGRLDEAVVQYRKALEIDPNHVRARFNLGVTWIELGKLREAAEEFEIVLRLDPDYAKAYYNLGVIRFRSGDREGARKYYEQALAIDKNLEMAKSALKSLPPASAR